MCASAASGRASTSQSGPFRWLLRWIVAASLLFGSALWMLWPQVRAHAQAVAILWQLNNWPVPQYIQPFASEPLTTQTLTLPTAHGSLQAILYTPINQPNAPGLVILHGVHHQGITEPRMVAFARSMSACGLRVLTPEMPDIRDYQISPASITEMGDATSWLAQQTGHPVGMMGISFSGGLALMAAADPNYAPSVSFVFTVGAHDSMQRVANFYATGNDLLPDGYSEHLQPHEYGPLVLEYEHLEDFTLPADTATLRAALRADLDEDPTQEQKLVAQFTVAQSIQYLSLIHPPRPPQEDPRIVASCRKHVAELAAVSPHGNLQGLRAPVLLLHGKEDNIIPYAEAEWLERDLPPGTLRAQLISPLVSHVNAENDRPPDLLDEWRLVHLIAQVMESAERVPASR